MPTPLTPVTNGAQILIGDINRYIKPVNDLETGASFYAADTGSANAYAVTMDPVPTAYTAGMLIRFNAANSSTGAATLNVNALGTKPIKRSDGADLTSADIQAGQIAIAVYDGIQFQLVNPLNVGASSGTTFSLMIPIVPLYQAQLAWQVNSGSWSVSTTDPGHLFGGILYSGGSVGDKISKNITVPEGGTYSVRLTGPKYDGLGIVTVALGGTGLGTWDMYSAALGYNQWSQAFSLGSLTANANYTLSLETTGKNASSGGYRVEYSGLLLYRS